MPELPEVETISRMMQFGAGDSPPVIGRLISDTKVLWHKTLAQPSPQMFRKRLVGRSIKEVGRRGKYIVCDLTHSFMLMHLRMSGEILVGEAAEPLGSHPRLVIYFEDGLQMSFSDARKFGRVWLLDDPGSIFTKLGPEPLGDDLTPQEFSRRLVSKKRRIKTLLLDQAFLAGVGNIYADEALHLAKIHPLFSSHELNPIQAESLLLAIREVLKKGIETNGASIDWVYRGGDYQNHFRVYGRVGEPCEVCGMTIERIVVGQRGTYFCPHCQSNPPG